MTQLNTITVFVDKISGEVATSAKGSKFLKQGTATVQVRGKAETVRVNWFGASEELLGRGALVQMDLELSEYEGKTYTQLSIRKVTPAFSDKNQALITGRVVGFKEFNKVLSVEVEIQGTDRNRNPIKGMQKVTVLDKASPVAEAIKAAKGSEVLLEGTLAPSKGFADYVITKATVVGASGGVADAQFETAGETPAAPAEDLPF